MEMIKTTDTVVVPWDFSEHSQSALAQTLDLVPDPKQIHVVHVCYLPVMVGPGMSAGAINKDAVIENSENKFRQAVAEDPRCEYISYTTLVTEEQGLAICEFAKQHNADLIIMSSHGRTGIKRVVMGSVTERVIRNASCSVLVLRAST